MTTEAANRYGPVNRWCSPSSIPVKPTTRKVAGVSGLIGKPGRHLSEERRLADLNRRHSEGAADLRHDRQRTEIERVGIEQQAERHRHQAEHEREVRAIGRGHGMDGRVRHCRQHP